MGTRQADLGHAIEVQIREDLFEPWDSLEIPRGLRHIQRVPTVAWAFPDPDLRPQLAEGFQGRMHQQGMRIYGAVRLELDQIGFERPRFPRDLQAVVPQVRGEGPLTPLD